MSTLPVTPVEPTNAPAPQEPPAAAPQAQDDWWNLEPEPAPAQPEPKMFPLRAETGTVYNTAEDYARGIAEKDRMIAQQRADLEQARQILAAQGVHFGGQPQAAPEDPLLTALESAIKPIPGQSRAAFTESVRRMIGEEAQRIAQQNMQPIMPVIEQFSLQQAARTAAAQYDPNILAFVSSPAFSRTLEQWNASGLKGAIQNAARFSEYNYMLPGLLAQTYVLAKAAAPAAPPLQRPVPSSSMPPQIVQTGSPQESHTPASFGEHRRDKADELFANLPDIPLTKDFLDGRR